MHRNIRRKEARNMAENEGATILTAVEDQSRQRSAYCDYKDYSDYSDYSDEHHDDDEEATFPEDYGS